MPIEIRELIIKATVTDEKGEGQSGEGSSGGSNSSADSIVAECVDQVMEILKEKGER